jgi:hypothetical protein
MSVVARGCKDGFAGAAAELGVRERVMLYTLLITVCLAGAPSDCRDYEQPVTEMSANPSMAFVQAQALVAQWMEKHPGFELSRWRLEPGRGA